MDRYRDPAQIIGALVQLATRYHVTYRGEVIGRTDPLKMGRVQVKVPELGWNDQTTAAWCWSHDTNRLSLPKVGAKVEVAFLGGSRDYPVLRGVTLMVPASAPSQFTAETLHVIFQDPTNGDYILYDEQNKKLTVVVQGNTITVDGNGIIIEDKNSSNKVTMDSNGMKLDDKNGNNITMQSGKVTVNGNLEVSQ